jgi:hypothetical protein
MRVRVARQEKKLHAAWLHAPVVQTVLNLVTRVTWRQMKGGKDASQQEG